MLTEFQRKTTTSKLRKIAKNRMKKEGTDAWILFTREGIQDPLSEEFGLSDVTWRSAGIITSDDKNYAVVGSFETKLAEKSKIYDEIVGYGAEGAAEHLQKIARRQGFRKVAINESQDFGLADGISASLKSYLRKSMRGVELVSSEDFVIDLRGRLLPQEIEKVRNSIKLTEELLDETQRVMIREGVSDREIFEFIQKITVEAGAGFSWTGSSDPAVCVGTTPAQHFAYANQKLKKGKLVRIDYGVSLEGYCSDIQRDYFLGSIPEKLEEDFKVSRDACDAAIAALSPEATGFEVDRAGRSIVVNAGFESFAHGLGHTLGRTAHEIGPILSPRWRQRYGHAMDRKIGKNVVLTIEPTVFSTFGAINLEQDVLVDDNGKVEELSKRANEIISV